MSVEKEFIHAPSSKLDYGFDWKTLGWLETGETITSSSWAIPSNLIKSDERNVNGVTSVMIDGGVSGTSYTITNTITTSNSRIDSRSIKLTCRQR